MKETLVFNRVKDRQLLIFVITGLMTMVFLGFFLIDRTMSLFSLCVIEIAGALSFNFLLRNYYNIKIEGDKIKLENIWRSVEYSLTDLVDILPVDSIFSYSINPYLKFAFRDNKVAYTLIANRFSLFFKKGGMESYIADLKEKYLPLK